MDNELKDKAIRELITYINSQDAKHQALLSYWISDYVRLLKKEVSFDSRKLIRYKRGSIVKAHLGYRIGSEEGGLHYAIVVDIANALTSNTVTIVPLTSVKPYTDLQHLHPSKLYLGDEIYQRLSKKADDMESAILSSLNELEVSSDAELEFVSAKLSALQKELLALQNIRKEISRMKIGSIALVGQITTISKIRIYDPLYSHDTLSNIRLSVESLDKLDNKIKELFTYNG